MKIIATINPGNISPEDAESYTRRTATRAVLFDNEGKIAFLKVGKHNYHKLPGGGVEQGEDFHTGLKREIREEVGCDIEIGEEIGKVVEYKDHFKLLQESYVFFGKIIGEKGEPEFDDFERERGFELLWVSLDEALEVLKTDSPDRPEGQSIIKRERLILEEAQRQL
ncbi:MAG: NUDIX domain-containing protein [bacterium]|nr:NUDIX domain-containing protein [bacterium]